MGWKMTLKERARVVNADIFQSMSDDEAETEILAHLRAVEAEGRAAERERCARIICPACGGRLEQYQSVPVGDYHHHVKTASTFLCRASVIRDAK